MVSVTLQAVYASTGIHGMLNLTNLVEIDVELYQMAPFYRKMRPALQIFQISPHNQYQMYQPSSPLLSELNFTLLV